jgi:hypothetical protein
MTALYWFAMVVGVGMYLFSALAGATGAHHDVGGPAQPAGPRAVAVVIAVAVDEQVRGRPVDELEALLREPLPVRRRGALAHDPTRHRDELVVDVFDAKLVDLGANLLHQFLAAGLIDVLFQIGHRGPLSLSCIRFRRGFSTVARSL